MIEYLSTFIQPFFAILEISKRSKREKSEAISALKDAIRHTKRFVGTTRPFQHRESSELSDKWSKAAQLIRPFDKEFARVLEAKADYWLDPNGFVSDRKSGALLIRGTLNRIEVSVDRLEQKL